MAADPGAYGVGDPLSFPLQSVETVVRLQDQHDRHELIVIGHRGASGYRPEHTLASYELAILQSANAAFNGLYEIPTLDEVIDLARKSRTCDGQQVGVYPETKHPTYFDSIGLSIEEPLVAEPDANGLTSFDICIDGLFSDHPDIAVAAVDAR